VRQALLDVQRRIADGIDAVLVGRDIGTAVIPDAGLKIYLDASARSALAAAGSTCAGAASISATRRSSRISAAATSSTPPGVAPLRRADDAIAIVTDGRDVDDIVREIVTLARARQIGAEPAS